MNVATFEVKNKNAYTESGAVTHVLTWNCHASTR